MPIEIIGPMRRLAFFILILLVARPVLGQPARLSRVLRTIDFEERRLGNDEDLPMHWTKVHGEGLPHYVNGRLSTDLHRSGDYSFRYDLNGGSLIYRYDPKQIAVRTGAHYHVEAWCRTTSLPHARARLTAYFTDIDLNPILSTLRHSPLYASPPDDAQWKKLSIDLSAHDPAAAYLVVELGLLQPALYAPHILGKRTLYEQDIRGSAWWDDISISQVPKVTMSTDHPGNIFRRDDPLLLHVGVNDRFTDDLSAQLIVSDAAGRTVYQRSGALDMSSAKTTGPGQKRLTLTLGELGPGWYEAALRMSSQNQFVGEQTLDFVQLADRAYAPPDGRFGMIATDLPFAGWSELPRILPYLASGRVKLAVWSDSGDVSKLDSGAFDTLLEQLQERGITPTACLVAPPPQMAAQLEDKGWPGILDAPPGVWRPALAYLIARHANHLDRWQLGADGSEAFVTDPAMRRVYGLIYQEFASLMDKPDLAMPWPAWYEMNGQLPATVALSIPSTILPSQIPLYMEEIKRHPGQNLSLSLELLDRNRYGRAAQLRDVVQRVTYALAAGAGRIDLPLPFTVRVDDKHLIKEPSEMFVVLHTLIDTLSGAQFKGKVPIADGVEAFLFDRQGQGILVVWNEGKVGGARRLPLNLGDRASQVDLWGNIVPLLQSNRDKRQGQAVVQLGSMPIFLVGIDGYMARMRAGVGLDRPLLESNFKPHDRKIHFTNPYPRAIGGMIRLKGPAGWTITPPTLQFTLNPGETFDRDITIEFPYNSFAGPKTIDAEFSFQADENVTFTVPIALRLGLSDVGMQALALRDGADIMVQQIVSNYGDKPINYTSFVIYPGQARQERLIVNLAPGKSIVKRYRFKNVKFIAGAKVRAGVREMDGTRILNDELIVQ